MINDTAQLTEFRYIYCEMKPGSRIKVCDKALACVVPWQWLGLLYHSAALSEKNPSLIHETAKDAYF